MKTVFLHIGMPKTGTTSIQFLMAANKEKLFSSGMLYPYTGMTGSPHQKGHHVLVCAARECDNSLFDDLISEIESASVNKVLISSEEFAYLRKSGIEFIGNKFANYNVRIVFYVREQASYMESLYNQAVKTGVEKRDRHEFLADMLNTNRLNYYATLKNWSSVFGKEGMIVRKYDSNTKNPKSLVDDFLGCLGLKTGNLDWSAIESNKSVDSKYIEFLRCVNKVGLDQDVKNEKIVSVLLGAKGVNGNDKSYIFNSAERLLVRNFCRTSNRMLAKEFFPEEGAELFSVRDEELSVVPESMSSELVAEILSLFVVSIASRNV